LEDVLNFLLRVSVKYLANKCERAMSEHSAPCDGVAPPNM